MPPEAEPPRPIDLKLRVAFGLGPQGEEAPGAGRGDIDRAGEDRVVDVIAAIDQEELGLDVAEAVRGGLLLQQALAPP